MSTRKVRVRFAPSPTGPLHMGGVRTALYNYLFARRHGGDFILRIEDTDSQRFVPGAEQYIVESLNWCGITIDEGIGAPGNGGPHAPYRQSERREIYLRYARQLIDTGWAYYAFDTPESLAELRAEAEARGEAFSYDHTVREKLETSLKLSPEEVQQRIAKGDQWVVRFKMPPGERIEMDDIIRGHVTVDSSTLDDKVLYKSADALPTYHLANIVDDHLMDISHVIRGEEWLPSLPLHVMLYRAFGWTDTMPQFAHLALLLKPDGKGKLSKRDGDKLGFPVFPLQWTPSDGSEGARGYREDGYFPEAFINLLALLGWSPGFSEGESEVLSMEQLAELFTLEKCGKTGARFDAEKARWFNAQYLHAKSDAELAGLFLPILEAHGVAGKYGRGTLEHIIALVKERAVFVADLWPLSRYFFEAPAEYDPKAVEKFWKGDNPARLAEFSRIVAQTEDFSAATVHDKIAEWITAEGLPMGQVMNTVRLALVGESAGVGVFDIIETIGRTETLTRLETAHQKLG